MTDVFIKTPHQDRNLYKNEKRILDQLPAHSGLPKIIGFNDRDGKIILEKIRGLTLYDFRERQIRKYSKCLEISLGVASVLTVLHEHEIVHNELSDRNIMLRGRKRAPVIIDFQDAFQIGVGLKHQRSLRGSKFFIAPEKYLGQRPFACMKSDIYSLGAVIFYTITGARSSNALLSSTRYPKKLKDLVESCLSTSPRKRPTASEVSNTLNELL